VRRHLAPAGTALLGVLTATPGVHLFERWLAQTPAILVSHGLALGLLALAVAQWRAGRTRAAAPPRGG
jgi:hypothetical protein